jgi:hypothetical protein
VGALVTAGGCAITADRAVLSAAHANVERRASHIAALASTHRVVIAGLGFMAASGFLLFAADADTFLRSPFFWIKVSLIALLLTNGLALVRAERRALLDTGDAAWARLRMSARLSLALWLLTTLAGVTLTNAA